MATAAVRPNKGLSAALWVVQGLLAFAFLGAGAMKLFTPLSELAAKLPWAAELPHLVRFIGASELAGGLGLVLPAATRIKPGLTPLAALGLTVVMVLAAGFHVMRGEAATMAPSVVLGLLAAFVAYGRFRLAPISPRS